MKRSGPSRLHQRTAGVIIGLMIGASVLTLIHCTSSGIPRVERFILVSCDDLRADRLGCYGNPREVSPTIDSLAAESARFTRAFIPWPFTPPSHSSMLTSLYPAVFDIPLDTSIPTAAGILSEHGFTTAAFTADGWMSSGYGMLNGFDEIDDRVIGLNLLEKRTENWLRRHHADKFFLFLHTYYVHVPFHSPEEYFSLWADPDYTGPIENDPQSTVAFINAANAGSIPVSPSDIQQMFDIYDGQIRRLDDFIGRIVQTLKDLDLYDKTMLIVTSDHGEQFFEFEHFGHAGPNHPLADISTRIPLIIHAPQPARPMEPDFLTEIIDLPPTLLDAAGIESPISFQGRSLWTALRGDPVDPGLQKSEVFFFMPSVIGIRTPDRKLTLDQRTGAAHLFDLENDPGEHRDVAEDRKYSGDIPPLIMKLRTMQDRNTTLRKTLDLTPIKLEGGLPARALEADAHTVLLSPFDDPQFHFRRLDRLQPFSLHVGPDLQAAGKFGRSLRLHTGGEAAFPLKGPLLAESGAIEFWMTVDRKDTGSKQLFDITFHYPKNPLSLRATLFWDWGGSRIKRISFDIGSGDVENDLSTFSVQFAWDVWHHIFLAWENDEIFLLIDGVLEARRRLTPHGPGRKETCPGLSIRGDNCFLDDLRISDRSRLLRPEGVTPRAIEPEVLERLKALGYIK